MAQRPLLSYGILISDEQLEICFWNPFIPFSKNTLFSAGLVVGDVTPHNEHGFVTQLSGKLNGI